MYDVVIDWMDGSSYTFRNFEDYYMDQKSNRLVLRKMYEDGDSKAVYIMLNKTKFFEIKKRGGNEDEV